MRVLTLFLPGMPDIDNQLKQAIKVATLELCCGNGTLRDRLAFAVRSLDGYLGQRESWPPALMIRAQNISDALKSAESAEAAIAQMDASALRRLAERILHLYADCSSP